MLLRTGLRVGAAVFGTAIVLGGVAAGAATLGGLAAKRWWDRRERGGDFGSPSAGSARQADGTDSSAQFEAGIADEGMIPHGRVD